MTIHQLEVRRATIGASEVAAALGRSPWMTANELYYRKVAPPADDPPNTDQEIGLLMEPVLLAWCERKLGKKITRNATSRSRGIISATPDGIVGDDIAHPAELVEAKHTGKPEHWGEEWTDQVPDHVLIQAQAQCLAWDAKTVWIPVRIHGFREVWKVFRVDRHEQLCATIASLCEQWWKRHVVARVPPEPDIPPPLELLKSLPRDPEPTVTIDPSLVAEYERARDAAKEAESRKQEAHARLIAALGVESPAEAGATPDGTIVTYLQQRGAPSIDRDLLRSVAPQVYARCLREVVYRKISIRRTKK